MAPPSAPVLGGLDPVYAARRDVTARSVRPQATTRSAGTRGPLLLRRLLALALAGVLAASAEVGALVFARHEVLLLFLLFLSLSVWNEGVYVLRGIVYTVGFGLERRLSDASAVCWCWSLELRGLRPSDGRRGVLGSDAPVSCSCRSRRRLAASTTLSTLALGFRPRGENVEETTDGDDFNKGDVFFKAVFFDQKQQQRDVEKSLFFSSPFLRFFLF